MINTAKKLEEKKYGELFEIKTLRKQKKREVIRKRHRNTNIASLIGAVVLYLTGMLFGDILPGLLIFGTITCAGRAFEEQRARCYFDIILSLLIFIISTFIYLV